MTNIFEMKKIGKFCYLLDTNTEALSTPNANDQKTKNETAKGSFNGTGLEPSPLMVMSCRSVLLTKPRGHPCMHRRSEPRRAFSLSIILEGDRVFFAIFLAFPMIGKYLKPHSVHHV